MRLYQGLEPIGDGETVAEAAARARCVEGALKKLGMGSHYWWGRFAQKLEDELARGQ